MIWTTRLVSSLAICVALGMSAAAADENKIQFEHVINIGSAGTDEGQFKYVEDFAFTKGGQLLATDAVHAWVQVFDKTSGKFISRFGGKGEADAQLDKPEGIATDPDGNIFIADYNTGFVKKYDASYKWLLTFSEYGSEKGQNIKSEFMEIHDGKLYMPEAGNHRVDVFDLNGKFLFDFGGMGTEPGKMNNPEAAKFSSEGKLYVSDLKNDRVQVFDKDGKFLMTWGKTGTGPGEFKTPAGLAIDKDDNVYITEIGNDRVQVFDKEGKFLTMWGKKGAGNGEFGNLHGIIVDKPTGLVYVADTANNRIQVFRAVGKLNVTSR
jgi:DNA-binding beta-propeller fold protein YncE